MTIRRRDPGHKYTVLKFDIFFGRSLAKKFSIV